jgi:hypothetical protein
MRRCFTELGIQATEVDAVDGRWVLIFHFIWILYYVLWALHNFLL